MDGQAPVYSWEFIQEIAGYARYMAAGVALVGGALTQDIRFALTCAGAASVDIWLFERTAKRARTASEHSTEAAAYRNIGSLVAGRLVVKAALLVASTLLPAVLSFWGMVSGVLAMDTTIAVVGCVVASVRTFRSRSMG
ncbi:MAG: hypothetical protein LLG08_00050 [Actinomycetia bacterium]|nr:hypothetical protein [Actinomycetes bacterium]